MVMVMMVAIIECLTMLLILRTRRTYPGFGLWTAGTAASAAGFLLVVLRNAIPAFFTIVLANVLILAGAMLYFEGARRFRGAVAVRAFDASLVLVMASSLSYYTFVDDHVGMRIIIASLLLAVIFGTGAIEFIRHAPEGLRTTSRITGGMFAIHGLFLVLRALLTALDPGVHDLFFPTAIQKATFLLPMFLGIAWTFGFLILNSQRLEADLTRAQVKLQELAMTDFLTGIANSRSFFENGEREILRAKRYGHAFALLLLDLDHFKAVNDTRGHAAGDKVLVSLAGICKHLLRDIDIFARLGGEEFVIILPETDLAGASATAERLRSAIAESEIAAGGDVLHITVSIGVTELSPEDDQVETVLKRADKAMYQAKKNGRNRIAAA